MGNILVFIHDAFIQLNLVDYLIGIIVILYCIEGYSAGVISGLYDIGGFLLSFIVALKGYKLLGSFFTTLFHVPIGVSHIIAFAIIAILIDFLLRYLQRRIQWYFLAVSFFKEQAYKKVDSLLGIIPGFFSGLVLLAFVLTVLIVLPIGLTLRQAITNAYFGEKLVSWAQHFEKNLPRLFGENPNDLLTFFTVEPEENRSIQLDFHTSQGQIDEAAEQSMLQQVNSARRTAGLSDLHMDEQLQALARSHSQDMVMQGYFSHYSPDGKSPFDRMSDYGITYGYAGENLAFSSNVDLAMQGLMQSPGHRANILSPNFKKIGIGAIDVGVNGEMFSQEFTD